MWFDCKGLDPHGPESPGVVLPKVPGPETGKKTLDVTIKRAPIEQKRRREEGEGAIMPAKWPIEKIRKIRRNVGLIFRVLPCP